MNDINMAEKNHNEDKQKLGFYDQGPGPAEYILPPLVGRKGHALTHRINPEYSIAPKLKSAFVQHDSGPGPYLLRTGMKHTGYFSGYPCTMRTKWPILYKEDLPAANLYKIGTPDVVKPKAPRAVISSRISHDNKLFIPGPNAYILPSAIGPRIPDRKAAAECSLKGNWNFKTLAPTSYPQYNIGSPNINMPRAPAFTMRNKLPDLTIQAYDASPASYNVKFQTCTSKVPKGPHFGIRYNQYTGILRTNCDKSSFASLD